MTRPNFNQTKVHPNPREDRVEEEPQVECSDLNEVQEAEDSDRAKPRPNIDLANESWQVVKK